MRKKIPISLSPLLPVFLVSSLPKSCPNININRTSDKVKGVMRKSRFVALLLLLTGLGILTGGLIVSANSQNKAVLEVRQLAVRKCAPWVLAQTANNEEAEFLVILVDQADLSGAAALKTKTEKGLYVVETLRARAAASQVALLHWLQERKVAYRSFYIINAVWVKGSRELALEIAARNDVARLEGNPQLRAIAPINPSAEEQLTYLTQQGIEAGVSYIRAPEVWAQGFTGQGITIGGQDTGVEWNHPALLKQYRGWDGENAQHNFNWHDSIHSEGGPCGPDAKAPCDDNNHGTHTLGSAVGTDGGANQIGVAPGAKFIACRNMDRGRGTPATYLECFEFMLAPYPVGGAPAQGDPKRAPDITTNSWTCPPAEGCEPNTLRAAVKAQRAAGIMPIVAAGNGGSACGSVVDAPSIYDASYTVGAINAATGGLASFSARGPVTIDGSNRTKPDVTAPGVNVRSAARGGSYNFSSGTSMAAPHVAGAVALLWSARPELRGQIELTENLLNDSATRVLSAECGSARDVPNNAFGYGQLNIKAAVDLAATTITPTEQSFGILGGVGRIEVQALPEVTWRAVSNASWITVTAGQAGAGPGLVLFLVSANLGAGSRTGTLTIAGRTVTVTQPGAAVPFAASGRVTTPMGAPEARVTMTFTRVAGTGPVPAEVETNNDGSWTQHGFEPGTTYRVEASKTRLALKPEHHDFTLANTALNFISVSQRIVAR